MSSDYGLRRSLLFLIGRSSLMGLLFMTASSVAHANVGSPSVSSVPGIFQPPSQAEVRRAIDLAAAYMERACGPDGRFIYRVDIASGQKSASYNVIRHSGAIYALAMMQHEHPNRRTASAMIRAASFLRRNYIGPGLGPGMLMVWSSVDDHSYAELGAQGLGLVALANVRRLQPKTVPLAELQALGRTVLFLQREDGSFVSRYSVHDGPSSDFESLYYPGEAALGLLSLCELDHSPVWLNAASKALVYLARSRAGLATVPADNWALIATDKLLALCGPGSCPASREDLLRHAAQVCTSILHDQVKGEAYAELDGSFDPTGRTAPTATRMEGLLAALDFLPEGDLRTQIESTVEHGTSFLLRTQLTSGPYAGGMPGVSLATPDTASEIRIDYVQHALSAWLRYQRVLGKH